MLESRLRRQFIAPALLLVFFLSRGLHAAQCDGISPATSSSLSTVRVASGLNRPLLAISPAGDYERLFIVEQDGRIRILKNGVVNAIPFLDVAPLTRSPLDGGGGEEGLLGLAFSPDYASTGHFFVYHTDADGRNNLVVRYERNSANHDEADPNSRQVFLTVSHPSFSNHNGGMIAFGPLDGYLYVATGDGGRLCDTDGFAQSLDSYLGKLLRLDVSTFPHTSPPDNPFVATVGALPEIWGYGLRNPYRFSFDSQNGDLYLGDVGEGAYEEINYLSGSSEGAPNFGWNRYEGDHCSNPSCGSQGSCALDGYVPPILEYTQAEGACAVTGGYVYRGCRMPDLRGTFFYSDFCAAFLRTFRVVGGIRTDDQDRTAEMAPASGLAVEWVSSLGQDARGELYVVDRSLGADGELYRIVPAFSNLEVSGLGAASFELAADDWAWEDLRSMTGYAVSAYRIYRTQSFGAPFQCVHRTETTTWFGGDPAVPTPGVLYSYLVVAELADGSTTSAGTGTGGAPRSLSVASCPP